MSLTMTFCAAIKSMERGADPFYTNRCYETIVILAMNGVPVQSHMGMIPRLSTWVGDLCANGKAVDETTPTLTDKTTVVNCSLSSGYTSGVIFLFSSDIRGEDYLQSSARVAVGDGLKLLSENQWSTSPLARSTASKPSARVR